MPVESDHAYQPFVKPVSFYPAYRTAVQSAITATAEFLVNSWLTISCHPLLSTQWLYFYRTPIHRCLVLVGK